MYDVDHDGRLSKEDVQEILKMMVNSLIGIQFLLKNFPHRLERLVTMKHRLLLKELLENLRMIKIVQLYH